MFTIVGKGHDSYALSVNGSITGIRQTSVTRRRKMRLRDGKTSNTFGVSIYDTSLLAQVVECNWLDLPASITGMSLSRAFKFDFFEADVLFRYYDYPNYPKKNNKTDDIFASAIIYFNPMIWKREWSVSEYFECYSEIVKSSDHYEFLVREGDVVEDSFMPNISCVHLIIRNPVGKVSSIIGDSITEVRTGLIDIHEKTMSVLRSRLPSNSEGIVSLRCSFPEEVRIPCEQYLLYFAQFMKDAGVDATTDISHSAHDVLFTVTPSNADEALDKIRQALAVYLSLPSNPEISLSPLAGQPFPEQRMAMVLDRLHSDLRMANMMLECQRATIQAQQITITRLETGVITPDILLTAVKEIAPPKEDKEDLLGGTVTLKKYEGQGFEINLPAVYRKFRLGEAYSFMRKLFNKTDV